MTKNISEFIKKKAEVMKTHTKNSSTNQLTKRAQKKLVNRKLNSTLFFQIGLIISIVLVGLAVELVKFETVNHRSRMLTDPDVVFTMDQFIIEKVIAVIDVPKPEPPIKRRDVSRVLIVNDKATIKEAKLAFKKPAIDINPNAILSLGKPKPKPLVKPTMINVEFVPVFPGCEGIANKQESIACLTQKLHAFISRKFDTDIASRENLNGTQRIFCTFTIDANGNIVNIRARARNSKLIEEAQRVLDRVPTLTPARQGASSVPVDFSIPIVFKVDD